jgi:tRNA A37 threonylcarbamoyladenosine synthetase subunit TsaC/SUA5/YrdC
MTTPEEFDLTDPLQKRAGLLQASRELGKGHLVVIPTDTTPALAADAFSAAGRQRLARVKGWNDPVALQILFARADTAQALAAEVSPLMTVLTEALWPGPLSIMVPVNPSLAGGLAGYSPEVSLRVPDHEVLRELLAETGPLAVSGVAGAVAPGDAVTVHLEDTAGARSRVSTVVDIVGSDDGRPVVRVLRRGAVSKKALQEVVGSGVDVVIDSERA